MKKYISIWFLFIFLFCNVIAVQANPSPSVDGDVIEVVPGTDPVFPDSNDDDNNSVNDDDNSNDIMSGNNNGDNTNLNENDNSNLNNNANNTTNENTNTNNSMNNNNTNSNMNNDANNNMNGSTNIDNNANNNINGNMSNNINNSTNDNPNTNNNLQGQDGIKWSFHEDFEEVDDPIQRKITQMNEGITAAQVLVDDNILYHNEVDLNNLTLLSKIKDLRVTNSSGENVSKEYTKIEVTWEEPRLNDNIENIQILHYSTVRKRWEVFAPKSIDYDKKTITAFFYDLSPVGVLYKVKDAESVDEQLVVTSVKSVNIYLVIIVFGIVLALYSFYKARESEEAE